MARENSAAPPRVCPGRDDLDAFARGQLPPEKMESIAEHLSECAHCESSLEALHAEETVLIHLRREPAQEFLLNDPVCGQLEDRACAIPLEHCPTPTVTDGASADAAKGPRLPIAFGAYVLLARLGQGGMGIVYKARQKALKRLVALKMVRAGIYASPEERTRFQREGESVARVQHGHVVQIHEFGEHEGQLFFSMELLEGGTLASKLNGQPLPEREAAELVRTLARAVHSAHLHGIVHRDLKPGNVLFAADGVVKITDFGLAKLLDAEGSDTRSDAILGTPAYMAPEQARGEIRTIGPAADVYALGTILYEALTGQPPFRAETRFQTLELVRIGEPEAPSKLRRGLSRDLEAICLKCLEKGPAQRYGSAEALADDLERWLRGESPLVRPTTGFRRGWRVLRRHPRIAIALALLFALAVTIPATFWYRDPERPIKRIESELALGKPQTLIGETGLPAWYHWSAGEEATQIVRGPDGSCSLHSWTTTLLELVRDPQLERYRFRAEIRHEKSQDPAAVGIYFAHRICQGGPNGVGYFGRLWFNDIQDERERFQGLPPIPLNPPEPKGNPVCLQLRLNSLASNGENWTVGCPNPPLFQAAGRVGGPWRRLAVEVTPEGVRAFWGGEEGGELVKAGAFTAEDWVHNTKTALKWWGKKIPTDETPRSVRPEWLPRGSLGLYLHRGSASFRRVVVEPLPPSN